MNGKLLAALAALSLALLGCNSLTGVDRLTIDDGEGEGAGSSTGSGQGGAPVTSGAGGTSVASSSSGGQGSSSSSTSGASSSSSGAVSCQYPQGSTGVSMGKVVPQSFTWQGFKENSQSPSAISIQDYFDCDGSKGQNALLIVQSATWCAVCQEEASQMNAHVAGWAGLGIRVLTLMIEDSDSSPATVQTALDWKGYFNLSKVAVAADPAFSFAHPGSNGLPMSILVDPRTMTIVAIEEGYSGDFTALEQLAQQNAN